MNRTGNNAITMQFSVETTSPVVGLQNKHCNCTQRFINVE